MERVRIHKGKKVFEYAPGEVLLNFMFDFVNRFTASSDPVTQASFDGILGANWQARIDPTLPREEELLKLFDEQFRSAGDFKYVLSTPIEKISDRTHFYIVYGSRSEKGLEAYRDVEFPALRDHSMRRAVAREEAWERKSGQLGLFPAEAAATKAEVTMEAQVQRIRASATDWIRDQLAGGPIRFGRLWPVIIDNFMLRRTDAKQICVDLAAAGHINKTWRLNGSRRRTPDDTDMIGLRGQALTEGI